MTRTEQTKRRKMPVRALSISGPFAYWMAAQVEIEHYGTKKMELRPWRTTQKETLVLLHVSGSRDYDFYYDEVPWTTKECPKSTIVGAAIFTGCEAFGEGDGQKFERLRDQHCWFGFEDFDEVFYDCYGKQFFGHQFKDFMLFPEPVRNVPGDRGYWKPNPKKLKQYDRQLAGFNKSIEIVRSMMSTRREKTQQPAA